MGRKEQLQARSRFQQLRPLHNKMKYFQKLAEDPYVFQLSPDDEQELDLRARGLFLSPTTLQGEQEMIREMLDEKYPE